MDTITKLADERLTSIVYSSTQKICTSELINTLPFPVLIIQTAVHTKEYQSNGKSVQEAKPNNF